MDVSVAQLHSIRILLKPLLPLRSSVLHQLAAALNAEHCVFPLAHLAPDPNAEFVFLHFSALARSDAHDLEYNLQQSRHTWATVFIADAHEHPSFAHLDTLYRTACAQLPPHISQIVRCWVLSAPITSPPTLNLEPVDPRNLTATLAKLLPSILDRIKTMIAFAETGIFPTYISQQELSVSTISRRPISAPPIRISTPINNRPPSTHVDSGSSLRMDASPQSAEFVGSKRKHAARLAKVRGDLLALCGRWSEADKAYSEAVAGLKVYADALWLAIASEAQIAVNIIEKYQQSRANATVVNTTSIPINMADLATLATHRAVQAPAVPALVNISELQEPVDRYATLLGNFARALDPGNQSNNSSLDQEINNHLPLLFTEAVVRCAHLQASIRILGLSSNIPTSSLRNIITGNNELVHPPNTAPIAFDRSPIATSLALLTMQPYHSFVQSHISLVDRLRILYTLWTFYKALNFPRKAASVARELACVVATVTKHDTSSNFPYLTTQDIYSNLNPRTGAQHVHFSIMDSAISQCLRGYRVQVVSIDRVSSANNQAHTGGWKELQRATLKDAMASAEMIHHYSFLLRLAAASLQSYYRALSSAVDQLKVLRSLPHLYMAAARRGLMLPKLWWGPSDILCGIASISASGMGQAVPTDGEEAPSNTTSTFYYYDHMVAESRTITQPSLTRQISQYQGETLDFLVTLRNPYLFELTIDSICLSYEGALFTPHVVSAVLPPFSVYTLRLSGTPAQCGALRIRGVKMQLQGSAFREFQLPIRVAQNCESYRRKPLTVQEAPNIHSTGVESNIIDVCFNILPKQPKLVLLSSSLNYGAIPLYAGETHTLRLSISNISEIPTTHISLSFIRVHVGPRRIAETIAPTLDLKMEESVQQTMLPNTSGLITVKVHDPVHGAKAIIVVKYANQQQEDHKSTQRQLLIPISATVIPSVSVHRVQFYRYGTFVNSASEGIGKTNILTTSTSQKSEEPCYCMCVLEVLNESSTVFAVSAGQQNGCETTDSNLVLEPAATTNVYFKFRIGRQDSLAIQNEFNDNTLFKYRNQILSQVWAKWNEIGTQRHGQISLQSAKVTDTMIDVNKRDKLQIKIAILGRACPSSAATDEVFANSICHVQIRLKNLSEGLCRIRWSYIVRPAGVVAGVLNRSCSAVIHGGATRTATTPIASGVETLRTIPMVFLSSGIYEVLLYATEDLVEEASKGHRVEYVNSAVIRVVDSEDDL